MNNCELDIFNHKQHLYNEIFYQDYNINGYSNVGKQRKKQEDSFLISRHQLNKEVCLVAVADGMGGLENGALASYLAIKEILIWFKMLKFEQIEKENNIYLYIEKIIEQIDFIIRNKCIKGGTTLSFALILKNNTFFINIGDSRIYYIDNNNSFIQISEDHSRVFEMFKEGIIIDKDSIRYHKLSNLINSKLGGLNKNYRIDFKYLNNNEYKKILLFSDGVTDCLSDNDISQVISLKDENIISREIVKQAIITNSHKEFNNDDYYNDIYGGKDNATSCCYIKRR